MIRPIRGLALVVALGSSAQAATSFLACPETERGRIEGQRLLVPQHLFSWTQESAARNGIPWQMLFALIWQESTYCQKVVSAAGAQGLGQLMPGTAAEMNVNINDARSNIEGAARYLRAMALRYREWPRALAAYNAGPGRVDACNCWNPTAETTQHVTRIIDRYNAIITGGR